MTNRCHGLLLALSIVGVLSASCGDTKGSSDQATTASKDESNASKTPDDPKEKVTFTVAPATVGDRFEHSASLEMNGEIKVRDQTISIKQSSKERSVVETLKIEDGRVSKVSVRYSEFEAKQEPAGRKAKSAPVLDKLYVLERKGDALEITDEKGAPIEGDELAFLKDEFKRFGKPRKVREALAKTSLRVGEEAPELGAAFAADQNEPDDEITVKSMRLKERSGDIARFEYAMEGTRPEFKGATLKVTGEVEFSIGTGTTLHDVGKFEVDGTDDDSKMTVKLSGTGEDFSKKL